MTISIYLCQLSILIQGTGISKLRPNPAGGDCHNNGLHGTDFLIGQSFFPGYTKVMLHSRITTDGHGGRQMQHEGRFRFQNFIEPGGIVKLPVFYFLLFWQHFFLLVNVLRNGFYLIFVFFRQDLQDWEDTCFLSFESIKQFAEGD